MTLAEHIKELQKLAKRKGLKDAELIFSGDDEGNIYQKFSGLPTLVWIDKESGYYIESVIHEDEMDKEDEKWYKKVILIN